MRSSIICNLNKAEEVFIYHIDHLIKENSDAQHAVIWYLEINLFSWDLLECKSYYQENDISNKYTHVSIMSSMKFFRNIVPIET